MREDEISADPQRDALDPVETDSVSAAPLPEEEEEIFDESLSEEIAALIEDGRTYAEAEIAFQKTRAALASRSIGKAIVFGLIALIALHIAILALAVGLVIALEPLVTIWGAIAVVVGILLLVTGWLAAKAKSNGSRVSALFSSQTNDATS